jgi:hypothetical protein
MIFSFLEAVPRMWRLGVKVIRLTIRPLRREQEIPSKMKFSHPAYNKQFYRELYRIQAAIVPFLKPRNPNIRDSPLQFENIFVTTHIIQQIITNCNVYDNYQEQRITANLFKKLNFYIPQKTGVRYRDIK